MGDDAVGELCNEYISLGQNCTYREEVLLGLLNDLQIVEKDQGKIDHASYETLEYILQVR